MSSDKLLSNLKTHLYFLPFVFLLFIWGYHSTFQWIYGRYMSPDSYYSHGFLIPFVVGYLIWDKRRDLKTAEKFPSMWGFVLIVFAATTHVIGTLLYVFSVSGFSVFILIIGFSLFIFGKDVTRIIWFPLLFLLFMFPAPLALITMISFPLKILVANYGVKIVELTGIPILREGFNIIIPQGTLLVGNPCSGLRSLVAFLALGSLFAYLSDLSVAKKWVLFLLSVPFALLSNLVRVPILILWSYKYGLAAAAPDTLVHTGSGFVVFLLGIFLLYCAMYCLGGASEA